MGPDSFQWCPTTGQGATGTNWSRGSSSWRWGRTSSLWGWRSPGPGRLWSLLLWRYSRPAWTRSSTACSGWPCFGRRVGLDDPQRSLPTPTILWFCDPERAGAEHGCLNLLIDESRGDQRWERWESRILLGQSTPSSQSCGRLPFLSFFETGSWLREVPGLLSLAASVAGQFVPPQWEPEASWSEQNTTFPFSAPCSGRSWGVGGGGWGDVELQVPAPQRFRQHPAKSGDSSKSSILLAFRVGQGKLCLKLSQQ